MYFGRADRCANPTPATADASSCTDASSCGDANFRGDCGTYQNAVANARPGQVRKAAQRNDAQGW